MRSGLALGVSRKAPLGECAERWQPFWWDILGAAPGEHYACGEIVFIVFDGITWSTGYGIIVF